MVESACDVLLSEPERFTGYLLSDPEVRKKVYDKKSLIEVVRRVFRSDPTLNNIIKSIDSSADDLGMCLDNVFQSQEIQRIVQTNIKQKKTELTRRVKRQRPALKGKALQKEIDRRLKISISTTKTQTKRVKQVTIKDALQPVRVGAYQRQGKTVKGYRRSKSRELTKAEKLLIKNNLNKTPNEVVQIYLKSGLTFRSTESIRKHYYRMKK